MSTALDLPNDINELATFAINAPSNLMANVQDEASEAGDSAGVIVTKRQLVAMMHYQADALSYPTTISDTAAFLKYSGTPGTGLAPKDFLDTFTLIRTHAVRWPPIRSQIIGLSTGLKVFATQMKGYKAEAEDFLKHLQQSGAADDDLKADYVDFLQDMLSAIKTRENGTERVKKDLESFSTDMRTKVEQAVKIRLEHVTNNGVHETIKRLNKAIHDRATVIAERTVAYEKARKTETATSILSAFAGGFAPLKKQSGAIMKQIKTLEAQQRADITELTGHDTVLGSLRHIQGRLQNLKNVITDAIKATENLEASLVSLDALITIALDAANGITSTIRLKAINRRVADAAAAWADIGRHVEALIRTFREADEQFSRERNKGK